MKAYMGFFLYDIRIHSVEYSIYNPLLILHTVIKEGHVGFSDLLDFSLTQMVCGLLLTVG